MSLPILEFDLRNIKVADLVKKNPTLGAEFLKEAIDHLNEEIASRLRDKGLGWAIGYRMKPPSSLAPIGHWSQQRLSMEWEFHLVELVDGKVPLAMNGFQYVTLKEEQ